MNLDWITYGGTPLTSSGNVLGTLPVGPHGLRCKFAKPFNPATSGIWDNPVLVNAEENIWDIYDDSDNWTFLLGNVYNPTSYARTSLLRVIDGDASGVTDVSYMFARCTALGDVQLRNLESATTASYMFDACINLGSRGRTVTLGGLGNSLTDTSYMFQHCDYMTEAPFFDMSHVTNAECMFKLDRNLLASPPYSTPLVTNMFEMFASCSSLTYVPLLDTSSAVDMRSMFIGCYSVAGGALALYNQAVSQGKPAQHACFQQCGQNSVTGRQELSQIPSSWGGNKP